MKLTGVSSAKILCHSFIVWLVKLDNNVSFLWGSTVLPKTNKGRRHIGAILFCENWEAARSYNIYKYRTYWQYHELINSRVFNFDRDYSRRYLLKQKLMGPVGIYVSLIQELSSSTIVQQQYNRSCRLEPLVWQCWNAVAPLILCLTFDRKVLCGKMLNGIMQYLQ